MTDAPGKTREELFDNIIRPVGSNYRLGGTHKFFTDWGGTHFFFKMTDLCNEQYSIFVQIIGGGGGTAPRAPPPYSYGIIYAQIRQASVITVHILRYVSCVLFGNRQYTNGI